MRPLVLALLAVLLLAGCSSPPIDDPSAEVPPAPTVETVDWSFEEFLGRDGDCLPIGFCFNGRGGGWPTYLVAPNQRLLAFTLDIAESEGNVPMGDDPVNVRVRCVETTEHCEHNGSIEGRSPLPVHVEASGLGWPFGGSPAVEFERDPDMAMYWENAPFRFVTVRASLTIETDPAMPLPTYEPLATPFRYETTTGVCAMTVEPGCSSGPWRSLDYLVFEGEARRIVANATWDAVSPTAAELRFTLYCYNEAGICSQFEPLEFQGVSPLAIDTGDLALRVPRDADLRFTVREASVEPQPGFTPLTRQPFVLEGVVHSVLEVAPEG